ncbi:MFS transporter [Paenibacillus sp. P26]|nr:MFS transporter [Paenibacillus sp. P26]
MGDKNVVVIGFVLSGVFTLVIPFTTHLWVLMLTQAIAGFGRGFASPVLMSLSIKHMDNDKRATAMGFYQAIYGLGMFMGPLVMGRPATGSRSSRALSSSAFWVRHGRAVAVDAEPGANRGDGHRSIR